MVRKSHRNTKNEISFKASLFRFSFAFVAILVAGLVTNVYINQIDLKSRIPEKFLESETHQLFVEDPEIRFKKGFFPIVGIFSKRIEWKDRKCFSRRVVAQDVFLVLDFLSLLKGKLKPGRVDVAYADVSTPASCAVAKVVEGRASVKPVPPETIKKQIEKKIKESLPKDAFALVKKIEALEYFPIVNIEKFDFKLLKAYREELEVKGELFLRRKKEIKLKIILSKLLFKGYELPVRKSKLNFTASTEEAKLEMSSRIREGSFKFEAYLKNDEAYASSASLNFEKLPLSPFSFMLFDKTQVSYLWLNCKAQVVAPWGKIRSTEFALEACELTGPYGSARVRQSVLNLSKVKEIEVEFNKFQVDEILKSKRDAYFSGVFSHYGDFSSVFKLKDGHWSFEGFFQDSELIFSRNNLRDIQKINKLPFNVVGQKRNWQIKFEKIELDEGQFDGNLVVQFTDGVKSAQGRLSIHRLLMHPKIYKLMILAEPTPLSFYGKIQLSERKITRWSGLVAAKNIKGKDYHFSALKIEGKMGDNESALFKAYAPSGHISPHSELVKWVQSTTLAEKWPETDYQFREFSVRVDLSKEKNLEWQRGYLRFANGWQLSSEGSLVAGAPALDAWIQWDKPNRQYLKWEHKNKFLSEGWIPQTPWVKEWLEKNPNFVKENSNIRFAGMEPKNLTDDINEMGKKTIEKVKDALSIKSEDKKKGS